MKRSAIGVLTSLLTFVLIFPVGANYDKAYAAAQNDDYKTAFAEWEKLAQKGDMHVQATLAVLYHSGQGVKKDYEKAFYWYKKAAEQGNAASQANLGVMYAKGTGTKQNMIESYAWYSVAASAQKDKKLGNTLWGLESTTAQLTPKDLEKAKQLSTQYLKKYLKSDKK